MSGVIGKVIGLHREVIGLHMEELWGGGREERSGGRGHSCEVEAERQVHREAGAEVDRRGRGASGGGSER